MESTGEDPYLNGIMGVAMVTGYQGKNLSDIGKIACCGKHFAAYGAPIAGREYNEVDMSERTFREQYLKAYEDLIKAGSALVMTSFNTYDRIPASGNKKLMQGILREEFNFEGVLISDWGAIGQLKEHGVAENEEEAAYMAIKASVDIDMMSNCYPNYLKKLIDDGKITLDEINRSVLRILELKNKLGLFENPFKDADIEEEKRFVLCNNNRLLARKAAAESFVLLKNNGVLPLIDKQQKIAFIGPYIDEKKIYSSWAIFAHQEDSTTIQSAAIKRFSDYSITFDKGCLMLDKIEYEQIGEDYPCDDTTVLLSEAINHAKEADVVVLAIGEHRLQSGEAASRADITVSHVQMELFQKIYEVNKNVVILLFNGRPLDIRELQEKAAAILEVWMPGTEGGSAICDVISGDKNPSGKLSMSFPYSVGQVPVFYNEMSVGHVLDEENNKDRFRCRYLDIPNEPLYAFGYGLSYTTFQYKDFKLDNSRIEIGESVTFSIVVENIGSRDGSEVVQVYIKDVIGSVVRPKRELKRFKKIFLEAGHEQRISFEIPTDDLKFYDTNMNYVNESGSYEIYIGGSSQAVKSGEFTLVQNNSME